MEPTQELIDSIYRERVLRARRQTPAERLVASIELFEQARRWMIDGVRNQFPDADEREVLRITSERLDRIRRIEEHRVYRPCEEPS